MIKPAQDQTGCKPLRDYKIPVDGDCTKLFDSVASQCITGKSKDETGGYHLEKSDDGCWEWWVYGLKMNERGW